MNSRYNIAIIIPYFGKWPAWIDYFLHSCRFNPSIDWIFPTDCQSPAIKADNLKFIPYSLQEFTQTAGYKLGLDLDIQHPYKICDFKPAYGEIFSDLLRDYDFWGYGDLDIVYGKVREFFPDPVLERFDVFSNHNDFITGHLCLLRNKPEINRLFRTGDFFRYAFSNPFYTGFDERLKKYKINPEPGFLERDQKMDRLGHQVRYWIMQPLKRLIPSSIFRGAGHKPRSQGKDFSSIVRECAQNGKLRVFYSKTFESDLMLSKQGIRNWEVTWEDGWLKNKEGQSLLYFHFILSKTHSKFMIGPYDPEMDTFRINAEGIMSGK
jgi:hypothetical protein